MKNKETQSEQMVTDVTHAINELDMLTFRQSLKSYKPRNKKETIKMVHFISDLNSAEKLIKKECYAFLDNRCADGCTEHEEDGLKVRKIYNSGNVYNETKETKACEKVVKDLEEKLEKAKSELQKAKDRAGFTFDPKATHYWKAVR